MGVEAGQLRDLWMPHSRVDGRVPSTEDLERMLAAAVESGSCVFVGCSARADAVVHWHVAGGRGAAGEAVAFDLSFCEPHRKGWYAALGEAP